MLVRLVRKRRDHQSNEGLIASFEEIVKQVYEVAKDMLCQFYLRLSFKFIVEAVLSDKVEIISELLVEPLLDCFV